MKMSVHCVYSLQASLAKLAGHHKILRLEMATKQTADETSAGMLTNAIHDLVQGAKRRIPMLICKCVVPVACGLWMLGAGSLSSCSVRRFALAVRIPRSAPCGSRRAAGAGAGAAWGWRAAAGGVWEFQKLET